MTVKSSLITQNINLIHEKTRRHSAIRDQFH